VRRRAYPTSAGTGAPLLLRVGGRSEPEAMIVLDRRVRCPVVRESRRLVSPDQNAPRPQNHQRRRGQRTLPQSLAKRSSDRREVARARSRSIAGVLSRWSELRRLLLLADAVHREVFRGGRVQPAPRGLGDSSFALRCMSGDSSHDGSI
jgi:hypothetical protein